MLQYFIQWDTASLPKLRTNFTKLAELIWRQARLITGIVGVIALLVLIDVGAVIEVLKDATLIYLFPALALLILMLAVKTVRWMILLRERGIQTPYPRLLKTYFIAQFYGQFLPASSVVEATVRAAESARDSGRTVDSIAMIMTERIVNFATMFSTASLLLLIAQPAEIGPEVRLLIFGIALFGLTLLTALRRGWGMQIAERILTSNHRLDRFNQTVHTMFDAMRGGFGKPSVVAKVAGLSLVGDACNLTAIYLISLAVTDPTPYLSFLTMAILIDSIESAPFTPGSVGVREGAFVFFMGYIGIGQAAAISMSLLLLALTSIRSLCGGLILLHRSLQQDRDVTAPPQTPQQQAALPPRVERINDNG